MKTTQSFCQPLLFLNFLSRFPESWFCQTVKMTTKLCYSIFILKHRDEQIEDWYLYGDAEVQHGNTGVAMPAHVCCSAATVSVSWIVAISRQRCSRSTKIILWLHFRRLWGFWEKHLLYLETHNCAKACYYIVSNCYRITPIDFCKFLIKQLIYSGITWKRNAHNCIELQCTSDLKKNI